MDSHRELIQVLAVAVAMIEDEMYGSANGTKQIGRADGATQADIVLTLIREERESQDDKWGPQHHDAEEWAMILAEEIGEWAGDVLKEAEEGMSRPAWNVLHALWKQGDAEARHWLETHNWPDRIQEVFDDEA